MTDRLAAINDTLDRLHERLARLEYSDSLDRGSRMAQLRIDIAFLEKEKAGIEAEDPAGKGEQ